MLPLFCIFYILPHHRTLLFFFFNDTATTEIYTLSLHDALPIFGDDAQALQLETAARSRYAVNKSVIRLRREDRKSTRLNSSHQIISYAVFCLKKKTVPYTCRTRTTRARNRPATHSPLRSAHDPP